MKVVEIRHKKSPVKKTRKKSNIAVMTAMFAAAFAIGLVIGHATPAEAESIHTAATQTETAETHIVQDGETLWDIARPVADRQGQDIREVIFQIQVNNDLGDNPVLKPGQKLVVR